MSLPCRKTVIFRDNDLVVEVFSILCRLPSHSIIPCSSLTLSFSADVAIDQANWDSSKVREKLRRDIDAHVASVRATKLSSLVAQYEVCNLGKYFFEVHVLSIQTSLLGLGCMCFASMISIYLSLG